MLKHLRTIVGKILRPIAAFFLKLGLTPDVVTIIGTLGAMVGSLVFISRGHLFVGTMVITFFVLFDVLDGTMARLAGTSGPWGAFLDSVLDRFADGALFAAIAIYLVSIDEHWGALGALACLVLGSIVPYARAKAESLGCDVLALDSGVQRDRAHRFYFREGMHISSFCFRKVLK